MVGVFFRPVFGKRDAFDRDAFEMVARDFVAEGPPGQFDFDLMCRSSTRQQGQYKHKKRTWQWVCVF
jgi:hypothetical protein